MAENEVSALIAQMRKCHDIAKEQSRPLCEEHRLEFKTMELMLLGIFAHRGPGYEITPEQALELATVMNEFRQSALADGAEEPPFEETWALARRLMDAPKPAKH